MLPNARAIADIWINRHTRDNAARRAARQAIENLSPAVVITGASRGIGLAFARTFVAHGHSVVLIARTPADLARAACELAPGTATRVLTHACDVTAPDAYAAISAFLARNGCYLDGVVNNAAVGLSGPFETACAEKLDTMLTLNIAALTRFTQCALADMLARERGMIVNVASLGGVVPGPHQAAYYATKAYVLSLTEALATETSGRGVRISAIAPGPVDTTFHSAMGADRAAYRTLLPSLSPDAIANHSYRMMMLGQRVIVPGVVARAMYGALRVTPHSVSAMLTGWLLRNPQR